MDWITQIIQAGVTLLVGAGVIRELWKMRGELSCIKGEFAQFRKQVVKTLDDHEDRIRIQEKQDG